MRELVHRRAHRVPRVLGLTDELVHRLEEPAREPLVSLGADLVRRLVVEPIRIGL